MKENFLGPCLLALPSLSPLGSPQADQLYQEEGGSTEAPSGEAEQGGFGPETLNSLLLACRKEKVIHCHCD